MRGLKAYILVRKNRPPTESNVIAGKYSQCVLTGGDGVPELDEPTADCPEVKLVRRRWGKEYLHAVPAITKKTRWTFGGCFVISSDSRFPNDYPIPLHDVEFFEQEG